MNVTVEIKPSAALARQLAAARTLPARFLQGMGKALAMSGPMIVGNAVKHRFTHERGPFPFAAAKLGRVSGQLRQSIYATKPQINPGSNEVAMGFGSPLKYFGVHEFGFTGNVRVRAHQRRGRPVKAHSRYVMIRARRPMYSELDDDRTLAIVFENARRQTVLMLREAKGGTP